LNLNPDKQALQLAPIPFQLRFIQGAKLPADQSFWCLRDFFYKPKPPPHWLPPHQEPPRPYLLIPSLEQNILNAAGSVTALLLHRLPGGIDAPAALYGEGVLLDPEEKQRLLQLACWTRHCLSRAG
jgi:hypothetical protein